MGVNGDLNVSCDGGSLVRAVHDRECVCFLVWIPITDSGRSSDRVISVDDGEYVFNGHRGRWTIRPQTCGHLKKLL